MSRRRMSLPGALTSLLGVALFLLSSCGGPDRPGAKAHLIEGSPDFAGLALELDGEDGSDSNGSLRQPLADASLEQSLSTDTPRLFPAVRDTVRGINEIIARYLRAVEYLVRESPVVSGEDAAVWLETVGTLEYRLRIENTAEKRYEAVLEARQAGTEDLYVTLLEGHLIKGDQPHRGVGELRLELSALNGLEPSRFPATGKLKVRFAHVGAAKRLKVALIDFRKDDAAQPASATYVYTQVGRRGTGTGAIKLAVHANLHSPSDASKTAREWLLVRGRWISGFRARFDAVAFGGDLPQDGWVRGRECLNESGAAAFKLLVFHQAGQTPVVLEKYGEVAACAPLLRQDPPAEQLPEDPAEAQAEAEDDTEVEAPVE